MAQKKACYRSTINNTPFLFPSAQANIPSFSHVLPKLFHTQKPFVLIQSLLSESHKRQFQYGMDIARQPASSNGHISRPGHRISSVFRAAEPSTTHSPTSLWAFIVLPSAVDNEQHCGHLILYRFSNRLNVDLLKELMD